MFKLIWLGNGNCLFRRKSLRFRFFNRFLVKVGLFCMLFFIVILNFFIINVVIIFFLEFFWDFDCWLFWKEGNYFIFVSVFLEDFKLGVWMNWGFLFVML